MDPDALTGDRYLQLTLDKIPQIISPFEMPYQHAPTLCKSVSLIPEKANSILVFLYSGI